MQEVTESTTQGSWLPELWRRPAPAVTNFMYDVITQISATFILRQQYLSHFRTIITMSTSTTQQVATFSIESLTCEYPISLYVEDN